MRTITALFDTYDHAASAVRSLKDAGIQSPEYFAGRQQHRRRFPRRVRPGGRGRRRGGRRCRCGCRRWRRPARRPRHPRHPRHRPGGRRRLAAGDGRRRPRRCGSRRRRRRPARRPRQCGRAGRASPRLCRRRAPRRHPGQVSAPTTAAPTASKPSSSMPPASTSMPAGPTILPRAGTASMRTPPAYSEEQIRDYRSAYGQVPPIV